MPTALSPDKLRLVLRRAAELERRADERGDAGELDVREIADEVGISPEAVKRALVEMDAGVLERTPSAGTLDRLIGPAEVVVERTIAGRPEALRPRIEAFLASQLLRPARRFGDRTVWRAEQHVWSRVRRALDFTGRFELPRQVGVESLVMAEGEDKSLVRFTIRLDEPRRRRAWGALAGTLAGVAVAAGGIAVAQPIAWDVVFAASGAGIAGGTLFAMRRGQQDDVRVAQEGLERFLDGV
jgi:DNA-binding Lrp family transcriptional regulator